LDDDVGGRERVEGVDEDGRKGGVEGAGEGGREGGSLCTTKEED
jgi:hypothetical protein